MDHMVNMISVNNGYSIKDLQNFRDYKGNTGNTGTGNK